MTGNKFPKMWKEQCSKLLQGILTFQNNHTLLCFNSNIDENEKYLTDTFL